MFNKNFYAIAIASFCSISVLHAAINKVEVQVQLQVGDKVKESTITVDSESYTQLSMDNEALGFALKLVDAKEGNERIETTPTHNKKHIANFFRTGESMTIEAGCNLNGYRFEKNLAVKFVTIKKIS
jgi:hypothetical protein